MKLFDASPMRDLVAWFSPGSPESAMSEETVARDGGNVRERRRHERYVVHGDAEVMVTDGTLLFRGSTVDISLSGCFIETRARLVLAPGTLVQMVFRAGRQTLRMDATVRAVRPGVGAGFLFGTMSTYMQAVLEGLIAEMQARARTSIR